MSTIRPSVVGACVLCLVAGVITGLAIGRARPPATPNIVAPKPTPRETPQGVPPATETKADDPAALKERVVQQRAEIESLRAQVENSSRKQEAGAQQRDKAALAKEIYDKIISSMKSPTGIEMIQSLQRVRELDETAAPFLIEQYRRSKGEEREIALSMALTVGGRTVADFIKKSLLDSGLSGNDRKSIYEGLDSLNDGGFFLPKPLPVDPELSQAALSLAVSSDGDERAAGVNLLSQWEDPASRAKLLQLAVGDPETRVRGKALYALGRVGDRATLAYLKSLSLPADSPLAGYLVYAISMLQEKFPD